MSPSGLADQIDELMKADLLNWRELWFGWLIRSTMVVIVGLILEAPELWYEILSIARSRCRFLRYRIILMEDRLEKATLIAFLGWILIVVGVTGEVVTEILVFSADRNIETFDGITTRDANKAAGAAKASAEIAFVAASRAEASAGEAQEKTNKLRGDLAKATADANAAQARLEGLLKEAGAAETDLKEYVVKVAKTALSRRISDPKKFMADLKEEDREVVRLLYAPNDAESWDFAFDIRKWLGPGGAGWDVSVPTPIPQDWPTPRGRPELETAPLAVKCGAWTGRGVGVRSGVAFLASESDSFALRALERAFSNDGFSTVVRTNVASVPRGTIVLCVGQRQ
jgi:hypothetical protein